LKQDAIDKAIQKELNKVAKIMKNKTFSDYCDYEDEVGRLIGLHCPICRNEIEHIGIEIGIMMTNIRNYVRYKAKIIFI
jgi:predicted RecB family nuclease